MMDHGYFDGPWGGGMRRTGKPWILTEDGKAWLASLRSAQGTEAGTAETQGGSVHDGPVPEGNAPKGDTP